jgi:hypothetical protein
VCITGRAAGLAFLRTQTVRYDLVRERGAWSDIRGAVDGQEWSIRKLLYQGINSPQRG